MITTKKWTMHNPAYPGEILRDIYLKPLGVTIARAARAMGVSRKHISAVVNGRASISPEMAVRLAAALGTDPEIWINLQSQYDLWRIRRKTMGKPKVERLVAA